MLEMVPLCTYMRMLALLVLRRWALKVVHELPVGIWNERGGKIVFQNFPSLYYELHSIHDSIRFTKYSQFHRMIFRKLVLHRASPSPSAHPKTLSFFEHTHFARIREKNDVQFYRWLFSNKSRILFPSTLCNLSTNYSLTFSNTMRRVKTQPRVDLLFDWKMHF